MKISLNVHNNNTNKANFSGHDAKELSAILIRSVQGRIPQITALSNELGAIGNQYGIDIFVQGKKSITRAGATKLKPNDTMFITPHSAFPQDSLTFLSNGEMLVDPPKSSTNNALANFLKRTIKPHDKKHIEGGNFFIIGEDTVLIGENELKHNSVEDVKRALNVKKVIPLPQGDFHNDLVIRPLTDKNVLVADDELTRLVIEDGMEKAYRYLSHTNDDEVLKFFRYLEQLRAAVYKAKMEEFVYEQAVRSQGKKTYAASENIMAALKSSGFNPIPVPGRLYLIHPLKDTGTVSRQLSRQFLINYMNGIAHKKTDGGIVYITNKATPEAYNYITKSIISKLDFSFEDAFKKSIKAFVNPEDVHFVSADKYVPETLLRVKEGGLHCMTASIPKLSC